MKNLLLCDKFHNKKFKLQKHAFKPFLLQFVEQAIRPVWQAQLHSLYTERHAELYKRHDVHLFQASTAQAS